MADISATIGLAFKRDIAALWSSRSDTDTRHRIYNLLRLLTDIRDVNLGCEIDPDGPFILREWVCRYGHGKRPLLYICHSFKNPMAAFRRAKRRSRRTAAPEHLRIEIWRENKLLRFWARGDGADWITFNPRTRAEQ